MEQCIDVPCSQHVKVMNVCSDLSQCKGTFYPKFQILGEFALVIRINISLSLLFQFHQKTIEFT